jgi:hypothetical protein
MRDIKKSFEIFKEEFILWQKYFGLIYWRIDFSIAPLKESKADIKTDCESYTAEVRFNKGNRDDEELVRQTAKHEAIHLLLARLSECAYDPRGYSTTDISAAEEELVRRLTIIIGGK